jgi:hypothetical protein
LKDPPIRASHAGWGIGIDGLGIENQREHFLTTALGSLSALAKREKGRGIRLRLDDHLAGLKPMKDGSSLPGLLVLKGSEKYFGNPVTSQTGCAVGNEMLCRIERASHGRKGGNRSLAPGKPLKLGEKFLQNQFIRSPDFDAEAAYFLFCRNQVAEAFEGKLRLTEMLRTHQRGGSSLDRLQVLAVFGQLGLMDIGSRLQGNTGKQA